MSDLTGSMKLGADAARNRPVATALADHPLLQLTLVRIREFAREPEAIFWVFVFPILLAAGLGIAFRNRPADVLPVACTNSEIARALGREKLLSVRVMPEAEAEQALRTGKVTL